MHLLILTPGFPADESDTVCVPFLQTWLKEAAKHFTIKVIAFQYPFAEKHYHWNGIEVYAAGGNNAEFPFRFLTWHKVFRQAKRWHRLMPFERITSFWATETGFEGMWIGKKWGLMQDIWILGQDAKRENQYPKWISGERNQFIAISPFLANSFTENHQKKVQAVIPLGLSMPPNLPEIKDRKIEIIGLGALAALKHFEQFVEIIETLKKDFPHIRAVIIGDGPEKERLQSQIKAANLTQNILLSGRLPHEAIFPILKNSKILLHTSEYEGQCMVFWEALACGCYVAAKPVGYLPETGKTFASPDLPAMTEQIKKWLRTKKPDFSPYIYEMSQTINEYRKML